MDSPHRFSAGLVDMPRWLEGMGTPQTLTPLQVLLFRISKVHSLHSLIEFHRVYK